DAARQATWRESPLAAPPGAASGDVRPRSGRPPTDGGRAGATGRNRRPPVRTGGVATPHSSYGTPSRQARSAFGPLATGEAFQRDLGVDPVDAHHLVAR